MKFLRNLLATIVGLFIFSILAFFIMVGIFSAIASSEKKVEVKENSILHLNLNRQVVEKTLEDPLGDLPFPPGVTRPIGLIDVLDAIEHAKTDEKIKGIYLDASGIMAGISSMHEIRKSLSEFQDSGKFVMTYGSFFSEGAYYLSSVADQFILHPQALVEFNGLRYSTVFLKGTLDKLKIEPVIFRVGEFKSAAEPFTRTEMSEADRQQASALIGSIYDNMLNEMGETTSKSAEELENIADSLLVWGAEEVVSYGLVDQLGYYDEVLDMLSEKMEVDEPDDLEFIKVDKYLRSFETETDTRNRIAVIVASGEIVGGEGEIDNVGAERFAKAIRRVRDDDNIKAVVLRVNSPGGSGIASDYIWREIELTKQKKPVIASMSDMATSGGYYISMGCDTIIANPSTITGSIGVIGMFFNFKGFLNDKLGITTDGVSTGEHSDIFSATTPMGDYERSVIQNSLEEMYDDFVSKAAEGRDLDKDSILALAGGRVWSGEQALNLGLVDMLGDYKDALHIAAEKAGLDAGDYKVRFYPKPKNIFEQFFSDGFASKAKTKIIQSELGELFPYYKQAQKIKNRTGFQARMPYDIVIE